MFQKAQEQERGEEISKGVEFCLEGKEIHCGGIMFQTEEDQERKCPIGLRNCQPGVVNPNPK